MAVKLGGFPKEIQNVSVCDTKESIREGVEKAHRHFLMRGIESKQTVCDTSATRA